MFNLWQLSGRNVPSTVSTRSAFYFERRPDHLTACESVKKYLWDPSEGTVCNRSGRSWCLLTVFYLFFLVMAFGTSFAAMIGVIELIKHFAKEPIESNSGLQVPGHV